MLSENETYNRTHFFDENPDTYPFPQRTLGLDIGRLKREPTCMVAEAPSMNCESLTYTVRDTNRLHA